MATSSLSLKQIVNVIINLSPKAAPRKAFNLGLIIGSAAVIPASERIRIYTDTDSMLEDGFTTADAEFKAAQLVFSQPLPPTRLAIGRWDKTKPETALEAVTACRDADNEWYTFTVCGATTADVKAIATYIESATPSSAYFFTTADFDIPAGTAGNIFEFLKEKLYRRTLGQYCSHSDTPDAVAAILGYAMGANNGTANSAYTLAYKREIGVTVENLTNTQVEKIKGNNGNIYINRGTYYNVFEQGWMADGTSFDELINLDKLANDIQLAVMDVLYSNPKVPQTDSGVTTIINAINKACDQSVKIGFIAPGVWNGPAVLNLQNGQTLPKGYLVQAEPIASQDQADRDARKSPPIYVATKLAGAIEFVTIRVDVNR